MNGGTCSLSKQCRVCGDRALGFNFNGLSCESCKAFFRRNAVKQKEFKCRKENNCSIDKANRKNCKRCRLKKCYQIGMKKELIWCYRDHHPIHSEKNVEYNANEYYAETVKSFWKSGHDFTDLNYHELAYIREIEDAMTVFPDENALEYVGDSPNLLHTFNLPGNYVKRYIRFCKQIDAFRCLSEADQLIILKKFYYEVSAIRFSFLYSLEKDGFPSICSEEGDKVMFIKFTVFSQFNGHNLETLYRRFCYNMNTVMENDTTLRNLIIVYFLFNNRIDISCPEFIRYNRIRYDHLIRRYFEHKYRNSVKAERKYGTLMKTLSEMEYIGQTVEEVYNSFDIEQLTRVLAEIYNLL